MLVVVFTFLTFYIIRDVWCCIKKVEILVSLAGIVLAFVSIVLSYKGLTAVTEVKEDLGMQQFKTEQMTIMAQLVGKINSYLFHVISCNNNKSVQGVSNLVGFAQLNRNEYNGYINFKLPILYPYDMLFDFFEGFEDCAYMPHEVAVVLSGFNRDYVYEKEASEMGDKYFFIKEMGDTEISAKTMYTMHGIYTSVEAFIENIELLVNAIDNWYMKNNSIKPNIVPIARFSKQS